MTPAASTPASHAALPVPVMAGVVPMPRALNGTRERDYPGHTGARLPTNAVIPSWASGVEALRAMTPFVSA